MLFDFQVFWEEILNLCENIQSKEWSMANIFKSYFDKQTWVKFSDKSEV